MEIMRFGGKVAYELDVAGNVALDYLQIPPLLLQPFVENAIWHGLMQSEKGGTVRVSVTQPDDQWLCIEITDDGIGRAKAAEYKSKSATHHKSFGMKVTAERIELINQLYHTNARIEIRDLTTLEGQPSGTQVMVHIPV